MDNLLFTESNLKIITVNYNLKTDTRDCIRSFLQSGARLGQFIVVDNASNDDSVQFLVDEFHGGLTILRSDENKGYAHGLNQGIWAALEDPSVEWLLLINNDTYVASDFLRQMEIAAQDVKFQLAGPVIYYADDPEKIWSFGDRLFPGTLITNRLYHDQRLPSGLPSLMPVDFLNGCAMLVRRDVFKQVGMFDTSFFMYAEEVDFCWRARMAGYCMAVVTRASMWHKVSSSSKDSREQTIFYRIRNQIWFYRRYAKGIQKIIQFIFTGMRCLVLAVRHCMTRRPRATMAVLRGWWWGWSSPRSAFEPKNNRV